MNLLYLIWFKLKDFALPFQSSTRSPIDFVLSMFPWQKSLPVSLIHDDALIDSRLRTHDFGLKKTAQSLLLPRINPIRNPILAHEQITCTIPKTIHLPFNPVNSFPLRLFGNTRTFFRHCHLKHQHDQRFCQRRSGPPP